MFSILLKILIVLAGIGLFIIILAPFHIASNWMFGFEGRLNPKKNDNSNNYISHGWFSRRFRTISNWFKTNN